MNCRSARTALPLFVGNDLSPADAAPIAGHLESCPACRSLEESLRRSRDFLKGTEPPRLDAGEHLAIRRAVLREIERRATNRSWTWSPPWIPAFAFTMAAVAVIGLLLARPTSAPDVAGPISLADRPPTAVTAAGSRSGSAAQSEPAGTAPPALEGPPAAITSSKAPTRRRGSATFRKGRAASAAVRSVNPGSPLHIELQTENPNVRIIWIVPSPAPQAAPDNA